MNSHLRHEEITLRFRASRPSCCLVNNTTLSNNCISTLVHLGFSPFLQELLHRLPLLQQFHFLCQDPVVQDSNFLAQIFTTFRDFSHQPLFAFHHGYKLFGPLVHVFDGLAELWALLFLHCSHHRILLNIVLWVGLAKQPFHSSDQRHRGLFYYFPTKSMTLRVVSENRLAMKPQEESGRMGHSTRT